MSFVRRTHTQIQSNKGRVDHAKIDSTNEEQIIAWKREDGVTDDRLGAARLVIPMINIAQLRKRLGLSQEAFASRFRLPLRTIQEWEQHRREPSEPARVLLFAIANDPKGLEKALK